ncbi:MAG TPA: DUF1127 domain-containing protein [Azospirillum sp.]
MSHSTNTGFSGTARVTSPGVGRAIGRLLMAVADTVAAWNERRRQRMALEALPDHLLSDIGVSRADADHEAEKPFWKG